MENRKPSEDKFGVPIFSERMFGREFDVDKNDPIERCLDGVSNEDRLSTLAIREVHGLMLISRDISVSIFGQKWADHVMEVYDRLDAFIGKRDRS